VLFIGYLESSGSYFGYASLSYNTRVDFITEGDRDLCDS